MQSIEVGALGGARSNCLPTLKPPKWQTLRKEDISMGGEGWWGRPVLILCVPKALASELLQPQGQQRWPKHLRVTRNTSRGESGSNGSIASALRTAGLSYHTSTWPCLLHLASLQGISCTDGTPENYH